MLFRSYKDPHTATYKDPHTATYKDPHTATYNDPHTATYNDPHTATYKSIHPIDIPPNLASQKHANDTDDQISTSPRGLCILYITLIARKLSKPEDGRYRPKHVVFYC